jgi:hypothetical protein
MSYLCVISFREGLISEGGMIKVGLGMGDNGQIWKGMPMPAPTPALPMTDMDDGSRVVMMPRSTLQTWACRKVTRCDREVIHAWYVRAEKISDEAMRQWLTGEASPWSEERANYLNATETAYDIEALLQAEIVAVGDRVLKYLAGRMRGAKATAVRRRFRASPLPQPGTLDEVR